MSDQRRFRWLKVAALAAWLALHVWLWSVLPPVPSLVVLADARRGFGFTADGRSLVVSNDTHVRVWDLASGRLEHEWPRPSWPASATMDLVIAPVGRLVLIYDHDCNAPVLLDLDDGRQTLLPSFGDDLMRRHGFRTLVAFGPDGQAIAARACRESDHQHSVYVWRPNAALVEWPVDGLGDWLAFAPDGRTIAVGQHSSGDRSPAVCLFDAASGRLLQPLSTAASLWGAAAFSSDGSLVAGMGWDKSPMVYVWNVADGEPIAPPYSGFWVGWNSDRRPIVANANSELFVLDPHTGEAWASIVQSADSDSLFLYLSKLSADGQRVAVPATMSRSVWQTWLMRLLSQSSSYLRSPKKEYIVFDTRTGQVVARFPREWLFPILSPNGNALADWEARAAIRVWGIPPRRPVGLVLALMIAEVGLAVVWTAWRRRRARRERRCAAG